MYCTVLYLFISDVPKMVPDVTVNSIFTDFNENNVILTLSWGEPFNNFDPIINYGVICSGDIACPQRFVRTDSTMRSFSFSHLSLNAQYMFRVVATNSVGSGEAGVVVFYIPSFEQVSSTSTSSVATPSVGRTTATTITITTTRTITTVSTTTATITTEGTAATTSCVGMTTTSGMSECKY